jgi:hypothetical protein
MIRTEAITVSGPRHNRLAPLAILFDMESVVESVDSLSKIRNIRLERFVNQPIFGL